MSFFEEQKKPLLPLWMAALPSIVAMVFFVVLMIRVHNEVSGGDYGDYVSLNLADDTMTQCTCGRSAVGTAPDGKNYCERCTDWKQHRSEALARRHRLETLILGSATLEQLERIRQMQLDGTL